MGKSNSLVGRFLRQADQSLNWDRELGIGFYYVTGNPYGREYFERYMEYRDTDMERALNEARMSLVNRWWPAMLLDVGVGNGQFVYRRNEEGLYTVGYDVNPHAVHELQHRDLFWNPYTDNGGVPAASFWDSLEHIHDPRALLAQISVYAFVSVPIFTDEAHVRRSKHFRPDEHVWYFTERGLIQFMLNEGFELIESNTMESDLGREDIGTFVFRRT